MIVRQLQLRSGELINGTQSKVCGLILIWKLLLAHNEMNTYIENKLLHIITNWHNSQVIHQNGTGEIVDKNRQVGMGLRQDHEILLSSQPGDTKQLMVMHANWYREEIFARSIDANQVLCIICSRWDNIWNSVCNWTYHPSFA